MLALKIIQAAYSINPIVVDIDDEKLAVAKAAGASAAAASAAAAEQEAARLKAQKAAAEATSETD